MRISDLYARSEKPVISFEFFPPKTDAGYRSLYRTIAELKHLDPGFVSVTWGAGGSTRAKTVDLVVQIQRELGIPAMAHMTCVGSPRAELAETLERLVREGLHNVLALRGDPPKDATHFEPVADGFAHASELVAFVRSRFDLCIGAACYPEKHPDAPSAEADLARLVEKVAAGTDFLITNLFFDADDYFAFVARARAAGIGVPIVPGIMPVVSAANVRRMAQLTGARIPHALEVELARTGEDDDATQEVGIAWATDQCRRLLAGGVPGLHFYTLNRSPAARRVFENLLA
ncbi:MAG: methylenetetrahydrofolate reductase [NAD(P)H] [Myxococcota bacterium]|jgi:methylenetetrahydrofolate reductase (NADPH)|nr:methylenetetrahydrofolate reductase [NAD(P)H] [Myxococcota bacterium]